jgi:hypothetical protein
MLAYIVVFLSFFTAGLSKNKIHCSPVQRAPFPVAGLPGFK